MSQKKLDEHILPDDWRVFMDYCYVADGKVVRSPIEGTAAALKAELKATEIRRCDLVGRGFFDKPTEPTPVPPSKPKQPSKAAKKKKQKRKGKEAPPVWPPQE